MALLISLSNRRPKPKPVSVVPIVQPLPFDRRFRGAQTRAPFKPFNLGDPVHSFHRRVSASAANMSTFWTYDENMSENAYFLDISFFLTTEQFKSFGIRDEKNLIVARDRVRGGEKTPARLRLLGDDFAVLPNVNGCAVHAGGPARDLGGAAQGAAHCIGKFFAGL